MTRPTHGGVRHVVWQWNAHVGRNPLAVVRIVLYVIGLHAPDVILLQESQRYRRALTRALRGRYDVIGASGWRESGMNLILVKRRREVGHHRFLRMVREWIGPVRRLLHPGRTFAIAVVDGVVYTCVHMPTGYRRGQNKAAWRETWKRLHRVGCRWVRKGRPFVMAGDWNAGRGAEGPLSPRALAHDLGAAIARTGEPIDYALVRGVKVRSIEVGPEYGSPGHNSILYELETR